MRFRRNKDEGEDEGVAEAAPEATEAGTQDEAAWALPADAAVASGGDVASTQWESGDPELETAPASPDAPAPAPAEAAEPISAARMASPGAGMSDGPRAAAAAAAGSYAQPPRQEPAPAAGTAASPAPGSAAERPELLVAGAFVGAFLFAKIIKRIGD